MQGRIAASWGASVVLALGFALGACGGPPAAPPASGGTESGAPIAFEGELSGLGERREFHFEARSGQLATIRVQCPGPIRVFLRSPDGTEQGEPGGLLDVPIAQSGTYRVRIEESLMGEPWKGRFRLTVELRPDPGRP